MKIKRQGHSYNLMLKKTPYHIITEQKSIPIPAAHPCTANYKKLLPRDLHQHNTVLCIGKRQEISGGSAGDLKIKDHEGRCLGLKGIKNFPA